MLDRERCGARGKIRYASKQEAKSELGRLRTQMAASSTSVYRCAFCDGYHQTKNERHGRKGRA